VASKEQAADVVDPANQGLRRVSMTIQVNPRARVVLEDLKDETGIANSEALVRLLEWFAALDPKARAGIINGRPDVRAEFTRLALSQMAGLDKVGINKPPGEVKVEEAAAAMHTLVDQMLAVAQDRGKGLASEAAKLQAAMKGQGGKGGGGK
jgi:hypothetical protein